MEDVIAAVREEEQAKRAKLLAQANEPRATCKPPATNLNLPAFLQSVTHRYASHTPSLEIVFQLAVQNELSRARSA